MIEKKYRKKILQFLAICFTLMFSYCIYTTGYKDFLKTSFEKSESIIEIFCTSYNKNKKIIYILHNSKQNKYILYIKKQPEIETYPHRALIESDVYDYEIERNLLYDDQVFYVLGREGFWIIQSVPFSITVLKRDLSDEYLNKKFDHPIWKDVPITKLNSEKDLSEKEFKIYKKLNRRLMLKNKT